MSIRARLTAAATAMLAIITVGVAADSPASAAPASTATKVALVAPMHGAYQNGCTLSPDSAIFPGTPPAYYNFHSSCDWHDLCYHYHYYGGGYSGRLSCDNGFLSRMRNWCANYYDSWWKAPLRNTCYNAASTYYGAVRAFGGSFF